MSECKPSNQQWRNWCAAAIAAALVVVFLITLQRAACATINQQKCMVVATVCRNIVLRPRPGEDSALRDECQKALAHCMSLATRP